MAELNTRRLRRLHRLAALTLAWEELWRLGWPLAALAGLFLGLALMDVLPILPAWLHALTLLLLAGAAGAAGLRLRRFRRPPVEAIRRRLENDSRLPHRPLSMLADRLAAGSDDPAAQALWLVWQRRLPEVLSALTLKAPAPVLAAADPLGLCLSNLLTNLR